MATAFPARVGQGYEAGTYVQQYTPGQDTNEPFIPGDFVYIDTGDSGQVKRCGTNPTTIAGISEVDSEEARLLTPNGKVPVRLLTGSNVVLVLASATTPTAAHIGVSYGITRNSAGQWLLDTTKTTTSSRVKVIDVDIENGLFFCLVHENLLQFADVEVATA